MKRLVPVALALLACAACGKERAAPDGRLALRHAAAQVELGPRYPGGAASRAALAYFKENLPGAELREQTFNALTPRGTVAMANLVAVYPGREDAIIILASHYDTKHLDIGDWDSANDGPSSAGLLLELGRALAGRDNRFSYHLAFFDGEESYGKWGPRDGTYGSRYLAGRMEQEGALAKVKAVILLDLIGDARLNVCLDPKSTPELSELARESAAALGHGGHFHRYQCRGLEDDHTPFLARGVPAVDLIDFDYGPGNAYWHTGQDTMDKLSAESLQIVGDVVMEMIRRLEEGGRSEVGSPKSE